jgi:CheY-like chemotaxis protein
VKRLLVADDDGEMRAWLRVLLQPLDADVRDASSGWELLSLLADAGPFDLVVTDVRMPGPTGLQVVAMARTAGFAEPFLVMTAFPDDRLRESAAKFRVQVLEKPFEQLAFVAAVEQLLH